MKTIVAALLVAGFAGSVLAQQPGTPRAEPQGRGAAGKESLEVTIITVGIKGPNVAEMTDFPVVCRPRGEDSWECAPEKVHHPKTGETILNEVAKKVIVDHAKPWKESLNEGTLKSLTPEREKAMNRRLTNLTAKLVYLNAATKTISDKLQAGQTNASRPEELKKLAAGNEHLVQILNDTIKECEALHKKAFRDHVLNCKDGSQP